MGQWLCVLSRHVSVDHREMMSAGQSDQLAARLCLLSAGVQAEFGHGHLHRAFQNVQPETSANSLNAQLLSQRTMTEDTSSTSIEHPLDLDTLKTFVFDRVLSESKSDHSATSG